MDSEHHLMLLGLQAFCTGRLFAEMEEAADVIPEMREGADVFWGEASLIGQVHYLYRITI